MSDLINRLQGYLDQPVSAVKRQIQDDFAEAIAEIERLHRIENAALRVASSRRGKIVTDQGPLDALDAALEAQS